MSIFKRFVVAVGISRILIWLVIACDIWWFLQALAVIGFKEAALITIPLLMLEAVIGLTVYLIFD